MTLSASTLKTELEKLSPTGTEQAAIDGFAAAWGTYFAGASVSGVAATAGSVDAGLGAMKLALVGMSASGAGPVKIQAAVTAFWATIAPLGAGIWTLPPPAVVTPPLTPPLTLSGLAVAMTAAFAANASASSSLADSAQSLATVLHTNGGIGGMCPVTIAPAGPVPTPIL